MFEIHIAKKNLNFSLSIDKKCNTKIATDP